VKADRGLTPSAYRVTRDWLFNKGKRGSMVLHSLLRLDEIPPEVDDT